MYITVKRIKEEDKIRSKLHDRVDALFSNNPVDSEPFVWEEPKKLYRTYTMNKPFSWSALTEEERHRIHRLTGYAHNMSMTLGAYRDVDYNKMYYEFKIPKRSGGLRTIEAPDEALKEIMYTQLKFLKSLKILNHDAAWAYTQGRDVVGAMKEHNNNHSRWYLKLDLENFFGSITEDYIVSQLSNLYPFPALHSVSTNAFNVYTRAITTYLRNLARLACRNGALPQGTPLSPILSNWVMVEHDYNITKFLSRFKKEHNLPRLVYTRYADDIIISCKDGFDYLELIKGLEEVLKDSPFKFNKKKTRYASSAGRNWNLGIMCNKDNQLTVGHRRKSQIKQAINNFMHNHDVWNLEDCNSLLGQLSWLHKVEPGYAKGLMEYYCKKWDKNPRTLLIDTIKKLNSEF